MYEAPRITEAGRLGTTTLGYDVFKVNDDGTYQWPGNHNPDAGSR